MFIFRMALVNFCTLTKIFLKRNLFDITAYKYTSNTGKSIKILFSTNNAKKQN